METTGRRKYRVIIFVVFVIACLADIRAGAAAKVSSGNIYTHTDGNTYTYTLYDDGTAKITECDVANADVAIPEAVDGHPVTSLGISGQTTRVISNSVTEIQSLYINSPYIQSYAFSRSNLHIGTLTLGKDITTFGISVFSGNTIDRLHFDTANATCPGGGTPLGAGGLSAAPTTRIGQLTIGDSVEKIPAHMFCNVALEQDELEIHVPEIGNYAFESHGIHIGTLTLTDAVQTIGYHVTSYCTIDTFHYNVPEAAITNSLNGIFGGGNGGATTTHIGKLVIGNNVTYIPTMAFEYVALDQDELTVNAARIGNYAFHGKDIRINTLNIGENVESFGYGAFQNTTLGTVHLQAVESACSDGNNYPIFGNAQIGQMDFGGQVTAIPPYLLKKSTIGNTRLAIPKSVTAIGTQWAADMTAEELEELYVYAITKTSAPDSLALDYPELYIHRESGFYDYFTDTDGGTLHDGMEVSLLCDDYADDVEYEDSNGIANGYRRRSCTECGYRFEGEYLLELECGEGVSEADGGDYYEPETEVTVDCTMEDSYEFAGWVDAVTDETVSAEQSYSFLFETKARRLRAEGTAVETGEQGAEDGDEEPEETGGDETGEKEEPAPDEPEDISDTEPDSAEDKETEPEPSILAEEEEELPIPEWIPFPNVMGNKMEDDDPAPEEKKTDETKKLTCGLKEGEVGSPVPMKDSVTKSGGVGSGGEQTKKESDAAKTGEADRLKEEVNAGESGEKETQEGAEESEAQGGHGLSEEAEDPEEPENMEILEEPEVSEKPELFEEPEEQEKDSTGCPLVILLIVLSVIGVWYFFRWCREYGGMIIDQENQSEERIHPIMDTETRKLLQNLEGRDENGAVNAQCFIRIFSIDEESPVEVNGYSCTQGEASFYIVPSDTSDILIRFDSDTNHEFRQVADLCREFEERKDEDEEVLINLEIACAGDRAQRISAMCLSWSYDMPSSEETCSGIRFHAWADQIFVVRAVGEDVVDL